MALRSEYNSSLKSVLHTSNDEKGTFADEKGFSPHVAKPSPSLPTVVDSAAVDTEVTYPEGGRDAWLVVLGAWCGLTASLGIYNTTGVLEAVISQAILPAESPSALGWLFSIYAFMFWVCGVQVGPTFDVMGPRALIIAGTVCTFVSLYSLSVSTSKISSYWILHASHIVIKTC